MNDGSESLEGRVSRRISARRPKRHGNPAQADAHDSTIPRIDAKPRSFRRKAIGQTHPPY
jgi:hypothetical protein